MNVIYLSTHNFFVIGNVMMSTNTDAKSLLINYICYLIGDSPQYFHRSLGSLTPKDNYYFESVSERMVNPYHDALENLKEDIQDAVKAEKAAIKDIINGFSENAQVVNHVLKMIYNKAGIKNPDFKNKGLVDIFFQSIRALLHHEEVIVITTPDSILNSLVRYIKTGNEPVIEATLQMLELKKEHYEDAFLNQFMTMFNRFFCRTFVLSRFMSENDEMPDFVPSEMLRIASVDGKCYDEFDRSYFTKENIPKIAQDYVTRNPEHSDQIAFEFETIGLWIQKYLKDYASTDETKTPLTTAIVESYFGGGDFKNTDKGAGHTYWTMDNGIKIHGCTLCEGEQEDVSLLEGLDQALDIETEEDLKRYSSMTIKAVCLEVQADLATNYNAEFDVEKFVELTDEERAALVPVKKS